MNGRCAWFSRQPRTVGAAPDGRAAHETGFMRTASAGSFGASTMTCSDGGCGAGVGVAWNEADRE